MSATGRNKKGNERHTSDFYKTPSWTTQLILPHLPIKKGITKILEPAGGDGGVVDELLKYGCLPHQITGVEIDYGLSNELDGKCNKIHADFLKLDPIKDNLANQDIVITNPPYRLAKEFITHSMNFIHEDGIVVMLLRLNFLGSQKRKQFWRENGADIKVLSRRPSFKKGGSDATEYGWFFFHRNATNSWMVI